MALRVCVVERVGEAVATMERVEREEGVAVRLHVGERVEVVESVAVRVVVVVRVWVVEAVEVRLAAELREAPELAEELRVGCTERVGAVEGVMVADWDPVADSESVARVVGDSFPDCEDWGEALPLREGRVEVVTRGEAVAVLLVSALRVGLRVFVVLLLAAVEAVEVWLTAAERVLERDGRTERVGAAEAVGSSEGLGDRVPDADLEVVRVPVVVRVL